MIAKCQLPPSSLCNSLSLADARQLPWNTPQSPAVTAPLKRGACPYPLPPLLRGGGCVSSRRGVLLQGEAPSIARRRGVPTKVAAKQAEGCSNGSDYEAARGVFRRKRLQSSRRGVPTEAAAKQADGYSTGQESVGRRGADRSRRLLFGKGGFHATFASGSSSCRACQRIAKKYDAPGTAPLV